MKKFQYSTQLDELAAQLRGIPPMASKAAALRQKRETEDHVRRVSVPGQWLRYTGTGIDSFFYVQGLGNGCLVGYQCHYNKAQQKIVRVGQVELSTSGHDILSWWPATKAMVRKLRLNSYL